MTDLLHRRGMNMVERLRKAMVSSGMTRMELAKRAKLHYSIVHRFTAGQKDMNFSSAAQLCGVLGLELKPTKRAKKKKK